MTYLRDSTLVRSALLLGLIFVLLHFGNLTEFLSYLSRPLVTYAAQAFGIEASTQGTDILLGDLLLPWTQDCSGVNVLVVLWGLTIWANRHQPLGIGLLLRLVLCVPAALLANVLRILTYAAYRYFFYPAWESDELHFFIGFIWLVPLLFLFVRDLRHAGWSRWLEIIYMIAALSLLAPAVFAPGGSLAAVATLFYLAHYRVSDVGLTRLAPAYLLWAMAALFIASSDMESLWVPWILTCPRFVSRELLLSVSGLIILSATIPLFAMRTEWQVVALLALAYRGYGLLKGRRPSSAAAPAVAARAPEMASLALAGLAPFLLPGLLAAQHPHLRPPPGVMSKPLTDNSYQIRVLGQVPGLNMYWYGPYDSGRHHSLISCMRFRGVVLEPVPDQPEVLAGSGRWMREFFIHEGEFREGYFPYLLSSFMPFTSPGVHLILEAPRDAMSAAFFAAESERIAREVHGRYRGAVPPAT